VPHSRLANPSATIDTLKAHGLYTRKALGQNFLVDDNVVGRIIGLAAIRPDDIVIEVGPGIGTLTLALCEAARQVVAVELDSRLVPVLSELAEARDDLRILHADAASVPLADLVGDNGPPRGLVANLPYNVAATVVLRFFEEIPSLEYATVMVQAEVADRITAMPGSKAYGAYTVKLGLRARAVARFAVPRTCFMPAPRVDSAVLRLERVSRPEPPGLLTAAGRVANIAFAQRRKVLTNTLKHGLGLEPEALAVVLRSAGIDGSLRAERLGVDDYVRLAAAVVERAPAAL
jgi:16S rRNA (adenine1518-N6/adenine1519-N6)-dimethyltransferase